MRDILLTILETHLAPC